jgi:glycosyltransferase involved in cell wall biosynthesis
MVEAALGAKPVVLLMDELGGGTGTIVLEVSKRWNRCQWSPRFLTPHPTSNRVWTDLPIEVLPHLRGPAFYPLGQLRRLAQIARRLTQLRPVIIHTYFFWSILYGRLLKLMGKIDHVVENRDDQGFNWGRLEYALLRLTASLPDRVVCVSEAVRQTVLERERLDPERVVVIHNGIDLGMASGEDRGDQLAELRERHGLDGEDLIVGMVANFNRPIKGARYFVEAMPQILAAVPRARFLFLGGGNEEGPLRARVAELGVSAAVVFAGFQTQVELYYELMDISVLTSLSEGLSMTLLESMSHGLPVVATRVGGNPELVTDGETGWLVPAKDVGAFASRVIALLQDPALRRKMGAAGRRVVQERFDITDTSRAYEELYASILAGEQ